MYPLDSDLHLVALSPKNSNINRATLQWQSASNITHSRQPKHLPVVTTQRPSEPPATKGEDHTNSIPSRHSGGGITLHSEPHQRQHLTSKGTRITGSPTLSTVRMWTRHTNMCLSEHIVWCPRNKTPATQQSIVQHPTSPTAGSQIPAVVTTPRSSVPSRD